uniref:Uncharacterized protein n=1 Tax=Leersia perrieri TaxID=77586 RepID=A0A0D9XCZ3_9ORYZ
MAAWWLWPLPAAWLLPGSTAAWFVVLNAVVLAIALLSSRARESLSPRSSFSIFSFPSSSLAAFQPDADPQTPSPRNPPFPAPGTPSSPPYAAAIAGAAKQHTSVPAPETETPPAQQPEREEDYEEEEDYGEEEEGNSMTMEETYAMVMAAKDRPEAAMEEEVRTSEVDAKAEEYMDEKRRQRLDSIFNYTQMLKQRAAAGRRQPQQQPAPAAPSGG